MLGKALYDGVLVDLPFAAFFVWKLLNETNHSTCVCRCMYVYVYVCMYGRVGVRKKSAEVCGCVCMWCVGRV